MTSDRLYLSTIADVWEDADTFEISYKARTAPLAQRYGLGLELAEFCLTQNLDDDADVKAHFEYNISAVSRRLMHAPYNELYPHAIDAQVARVAYQRYHAAWERCRAAGCDKLIAHVNQLEQLYFPSWTVSRQVPFWKRFLSEHAGGTVICLENVTESKPDVILDIIEGVGDERLKMCLDVGHANLTPLKPVEWVRRCAGAVSHYHIHNNPGPVKTGYAGAGDTHKALGEGSIPMRELLELAEALTPDATYTIESCQLEESVSFLLKEGMLK